MGPVRRIINLQAAFLAIVAQFLVLALATPAAAAAKRAPKPPPAAAAKPPTAKATAPPVAAEPEPAPPLFVEATFLHPRGAKIKPRWVLPPTEKTRTDAIFSVNGAGSPVLAFSGDSNFHLLHPDKHYLVAVNSTIAGMTHLANGVLLMASGNDLLLLAEPKQKTLDKKGVPYAALQPLTKIPLRKIELLTSVGTTVYCAGVDARSGRYALYLLRSLKGGGILDLELAYESNEPITAVTGDGEAIYAAKGRTIVRYDAKEGIETVYYTHPTSPVTGLAMTPAGLVISTGTEIVLAGRTGAMEIMRSSAHRIAMAGDTLYVFFNTSLGVLSMDNLSDLKRYNLAVRPVAPGEAASPLAIAGASFFASESLENTEGFAASFDRKKVRRIVARIELDQGSLSRSRRGHSVTVSWHEPNGGMLKSSNYQVTQQSGGLLFATLGGKAKRGYSPPHWTKDGAASFRYTDELAENYPGRYRMLVQVDGIAAGEWSFTLSGQVPPDEVISHDDLATLKTMLDQGLAARSKSADGEPLLITAVKFGSVRAVQLLLERGADPNDTDKDGHPPLFHCEYLAVDWHAKAELLVRHGANVNAPRSAGGSPLVDGLSTRFLAFLLKNGANFSYETTYGKKSVLSEINDNTCTEEILSLLIQRGASLNDTTGSFDNYSPLGRAIFHANDRCVQLLLDKGASSTVAQQQSKQPPRSALYVALNTLNGRAEPKDKVALRRIVRLLLQKGATLRPGKKLATSAYFTIPKDDYMRQLDETASIIAGEGRLMFLGEGSTFFEQVDLIKTLEQDDAALEAATDSKDPAIQELALSAHLGRVRELTARARDQFELGFRVHEHCEKAFKLSEANYRPTQVDVVPEMLLPPGVQGKPQLGMKLLKRAAGGAYIQDVVSGGPAERAGLKAGDIILALDTQKMKDANEVVSAATRLTPGLPVRITFLRDETMRMPDLQLTCGLVELEYKDHWGLAEMNLSRWLAAHPDDTASAEVGARLKQLAVGGWK